MKILLINNCHFRRGGADVVYLNTIQLLKDYGHQVIEFSQQGKDIQESKYVEYFVEEFEPLKLSFLKKILKTPRQLYSFEAAKKIKKLIINEKPNIAHIHLYKGVLTGSILHVLKKHKIPVCISLHDYGILCPRNILFNGENKICEKCINGSSINCVIHRCNRKNLFFSTVNYIEFNVYKKLYNPAKYFDTIVPVSKFNFSKHAQKNDIKNKLIHLYNFSPNCKTVEPDHTKGKYLLYFGRLSNEKGLNTLITAFKRISSFTNLKIVGTGALENHIKDRIASEEIKNIEVLGYKSGDELNNIIKRSSFIVVPSEWYENNPMTIIEGYSLGKPAIGSRVGGIPEMIDEYRTGICFEMGNVEDLAEKLLWAAKLPAKDYESLSINAREFAVNNFSDEVHYKKLIQIYKSLINEK